MSGSRPFPGGRLAASGLSLLLLLAACGAGCGDDAVPGAVIGTQPDPERDGCIPYDYYDGKDLPARPVVCWTGGLVVDADAADGIAVLASLAAGLRILDVADPGAPRLLGEADSPEAVAVDLAGDLVAVAEGYHGFALYVFSDPTAPVHLVRQPVTGGGSDRNYTDVVAVAGRRLFVSGYHRRLVCYDISDPRHPVEVGRLVIDHPGDLAVVGDLVVAGGRAVVRVSPAGALSVARLLTHGQAEDLCLAGEMLHAAVADGLVTYDVANPDSIVVAAVQPLTGARCVAVAGDHVFVGTAGVAPRLHVFDFAAPKTPVGLADVAATDFAAFYCLAAADGVLLAGDRHLRTIDVADPRNPVFAAEPAEPAYPQGMAVVGSRCAVFDGPKIYVQDIGAGAAGAAPAVLACGQSLTHAAANGSHMYFARASAGLVVIDPAVVGMPPAIQHPETYFGPLAATDSLLAAGSANTLRLFRLADPAAPTAAGSLVFDDFVRQVAVVGSQVLVSLARAQLVLVDAADPARPTVVASDIADLRLEDSAAVAWIDSCGLDFHAGGSLRLVRRGADGRLDTTAALAAAGAGRSLAVHGTVVYALSEQPGGEGVGIAAVDVADPARPRLLGRAFRPWVTMRQLQVANERVYGLTPGGVLEFWLDCRSLAQGVE